MASPSPRKMLLLAMVIVVMVFPSPGASVCETSAPAACVPTIHDPHAGRGSANLAIPHSCLQRQQQQHRRRQHQSPVFAAFAVVQRPRLINVGDPTTRVRVAPRAGRVALALSTSWYSHARCESRGYCHPRSRFTVLGASKSKRKPKKNKAGSNRANGGGGGGFGGAAPAALVQPTTVGAQRAPPTSTSPTAAAAARSVATGGELPDDDFATFPPLSADMLKSVMGVDVFDLPPRGIPASERGQEQALPAQVLQCIRKRHGLEEFAGGRRLLDPEYGNSDDETAETASTSASASVSDDGGASPVRGGLLFPGLRLLHAEPPVIGVDDFFSSQECDEYISRSLSPPPPTPASAAGGTGPHKQRSATLGADVDAVAQRTSTTWFHRFSAVPELMAKASALVGVPFEEGRWEEAQTVRYRPGEKFTWHLDALPPSPELASKGGQRIATLLVYLTDMPEGDGGATAFRDLGPLRVRPRKGSALLFFPSCGGAPDCPFDVRTLHAGEMVRPGTEQDKWIAQLWLRESRYTPTVPKQNRHADAESVVAKFDKSWRAS